MDLVIEEVGDVGVVVLPLEELDASNAPDFKRDVAPLLDTHTNLTLDVSSLRFIDSSGLGALLSGFRRLKAKGGDLKLFGMSAPVRSTFELVRMDRVFDILPTKAEAIRAFHPA